MTTDRRTFLQLLISSAAAAAFPASISRALAIPANSRTGTIADVEHIVIVMQENRSFDHLFGTLRGVRGYGDPRTISLPNGNPVWYQPNGKQLSIAIPSRRTQSGSPVYRGPSTRLDKHARGMECRQI